VFDDRAYAIALTNPHQVFQGKRELICTELQRGAMLGLLCDLGSRTVAALRAP
jgi:hypothetical protein